MAIRPPAARLLRGLVERTTGFASAAAALQRRGCSDLEEHTRRSRDGTSRSEGPSECRDQCCTCAVFASRKDFQKNAEGTQYLFVADKVRRSG
jgi:hypothetical protein